MNPNHLALSNTNSKVVDYLTVDRKAGMTPLLLAATGENGPNIPVLESFIERDDISSIQKIDALELAGATILLQRNDVASITQAFELWNRAIDLRDADGVGSIPKVPLNDNSIVHWRAVEWTTKDQLRELQHRPSDYKIQGLLVAQRILSGISSGALLKYRSKICYDYWIELRESRQLTRMLEYCWIELEAASQHDLRVHFDLASEYSDTICSLIETLTKIKKKLPSTLNPETLRTSLKLACQLNLGDVVWEKEIVGGDNHSYSHFTGYEYYLVSFLAGIPEMITHEIMCYLHQLVQQRDGCKIGRRADSMLEDLLVDTCSMWTWVDRIDKKMLRTVLLLLEAGADPNATDRYGNNALHILAENRSIKTNASKAKLNELMTKLIDRGAHLDQVNKYGESPLDVWKRNKNEALLPPSWSWRNVPPLACLSASTLRRYERLSGKPYDRETLPVTLRSFVDMH